MMISWKRIYAIFIKDYKDFSRNLAVSTMVVLPIILAAFYNRLDMNSIDSFYMLFNLTFAMVATYVQCCLIAEENEKNTLRGLMLSPASTTDILIGKSLLSSILTVVVLYFSALFLDYKPDHIAVIVIAMMVSLIFYIGLGTLLGIFAKSVMDASIIVLPVLLIFSFGGFGMVLIDQYPILKFIQYLPNVQLIEIAQKVEAGIVLSDVIMNLVIIGVWGIGIFALTAVVYRKRMVD